MSQANAPTRRFAAPAAIATLAMTLPCALSNEALTAINSQPERRAVAADQTGRWLDCVGDAARKLCGVQPAAVASNSPAAFCPAPLPRQPQLAPAWPTRPLIPAEITLPTLRNLPPPSC